jgi:hypothetical protein
MTRLFTVAVALGCLSLGAFLLPALSQGPDKAKPPKERPATTAREKTLALMRMLKQPIETKKLQEKVTLKTALEHLSNQFGGKLVILVDKEGFAAALGADAPDPYEEEVVLPPHPAKMSLDTVLKMLLRQVAKGNGICVLRPNYGYIEIAPASSLTPEFPAEQRIVATDFVKRPLEEVLQELADETGVDIYLDPNIGDKAATPISATFRNATLEQVLVTVTEMARLKYVALERSAYVTTPKHAKVLEKEERIRREKRLSPLNTALKPVDTAK